MNFNNLVVPTVTGALANAAGEKLKGIELEARIIKSRSDTALVANGSYHDAHFTRYLFVDDCGRQCRCCGPAIALVASRAHLGRRAVYAHTRDSVRPSLRSTSADASWMKKIRLPSAAT